MQERKIYYSEEVKTTQNLKNQKIFEQSDMKNYTGLIRKKNPIVLEAFLLAQTEKRNTPLPLTTRMQTAAKKK